MELVILGYIHFKGILFRIDTKHKQSRSPMDTKSEGFRTFAFRCTPLLNQSNGRHFHLHFQHWVELKVYKCIHQRGWYFGMSRNLFALAQLPNFIIMQLVGSDVLSWMNTIERCNLLCKIYFQWFITVGASIQIPYIIGWSVRVADKLRGGNRLVGPMCARVIVL